MIRLRHWLGFHGRNWRLVWIMGNVWTECEICHARRMVPFGDVSEMPLGTTIVDAEP